MSELYEQLKQTYTDEEIAGFAMISNTSKSKETEKARAEFVKFRLVKSWLIDSNNVATQLYLLSIGGN